MHTKILIRPENFQMRYQQWQEKLQKLHLEMLRGSYANEVFGKGCEDLRFENNLQYARMTWQPEELGIENISFLVDYLRNILLTNKYANQLSDERNEIFDNGLKITVHRHYLKPAYLKEQNFEFSDNGMYGNIFLEHRFNRDYNAFCLTANYPGNKTYLSFEKLMELLMG